MGYLLSPKTAPKGQIDALPDSISVANAKVHTDTAIKRTMIQAEVVRQKGETLDTILQVTENIGADSLTADSLTTLLDTLSKAARVYQFEVLRYQRLVDTLLLTHQAERSALARQVEALQVAVLDAENRARCSAFGVPCPTRWQAFAIGVGVAATILVLR
jgi:hypothetical protein